MYLLRQNCPPGCHRILPEQLQVLCRPFMCHYRFQAQFLNDLPLFLFLAALAALYLTLVSHSLSDCHFRILTQRVTFETSDPSDI